MPGGDSPVYPGLRTVAELSQPGGATRATSAGAYPRLDAPAALAFPGPEALESARRYLDLRKARVSFAVTDTRGAIAGRRHPPALPGGEPGQGDGDDRLPQPAGPRAYLGRA